MAQFIISAFADEASDLLEGQISALKRNGLCCLEPRSIEGNLIKKSDEEIIAISDRLKKEGISISAFGSPCGKYKITDDFEPHFELFCRALEICKLLGTNKMRMFSFFVEQDELDKYRDEVFRRISMMLDKAEAEGILLCHENEFGIYGQNPAQVSDLLTAFPKLRGVFDSANFLRHDQDVDAGFEATLPSLEYIHIKDAIKQSKAHMPAGLGEGHYEQILSYVGDNIDKTIFLTVEPHLINFNAFKSIDTQKRLENILNFKNSDESFDCAVNALKTLLAKLGYREENKIWKK